MLINPKLKIALICRSRQRGFALPIVMALGLIMILVAIATIYRSHEDRINATTQRSSERALNAAKSGVTFYQELINNNRVIAMYPDCYGDRDSNGVCDDAHGPESWVNAASEISNVCNTTDVTNGATTAWQNISGDPNLGQYRLRSYKYPSDSDGNQIPPVSDPEVGEAKNTAVMGTLTVEGRFNQGSGDDSAAAIAVRVQIPVQTESPTLDSLAPGLWIGSDTGNDFANLTVSSGNIILSDSACNTSTIGSETVIPDPRPFPDTADFPTDDDNNNCDNDDADDVLNCLDNTDLTSASELPRTGDIGDSNNYYHYLVQDDLNLNAQDLNIVAGTKVILYVQGDITFNGNVNINQANSSAYLEIYGNTTDSGTNKYGCATPGNCPTGNVNFSGSGAINVNAFIHAPAATVDTTGSPTVNVTGAIWANNLDASSGTITMNPDGQYSNYTSKSNMPDKPTISSPTELEVIEVQ